MNKLLKLNLISHQQLFILALIVTAALSSCSSDSDDPVISTSGNNSNGTSIKFDRNAMLENYADNLIIPLYQNFQSSSSSLSTAITSYCSAIGESEEASALTSAQNAWKASMDLWQQAELTQFGPLAESTGTRNHIYAWPLNSSCVIDQEVVNAEADGYDISDRTDNRRGLGAIEYLLFNTDLNHTCSAAITLLSTWNDREDNDRKSSRCKFAQIAADDIASQATTLVNAWSESGENFRSEFVNAGISSSTYSSAQDAINDISDALFYIDTEAKDVKIVGPVESPHANYSLEMVQANLEFLQTLFLGNASGSSAASGFDNFLAAADSQVLADSITNNIASAISDSQSISGTLEDAITNNTSDLTQLQNSVKVVTDDLKTQFLILLELDLPDTAAGDTD